MTKAKDNSSLPLLLSITGAVLAVAIGGWFLLYENEGTQIVNPATSAAEAVPESAATVARNLLETETAPKPTEEASTDVELELRKARLAADADILILPASQSALFYYGRALKADPRNAIANAELEAMLAKVEKTTTEHLAAQEFDEAYAIAVLVARQKPEHTLVAETQRILDAYTEQLVAEAIQQAQNGDKNRTSKLLATAESLPGRNPAYFTAVRESVADIQRVRLAAARDRSRRAQLADSEARAAWVARIQQEIAAGNLISPAGASARDLLAESNSFAAERDQLTADILAALASTTEAGIKDGRFDYAAASLDAAAEISGRPNDFEELRASLDDALIGAESKRIAHMRELVQLESAAPSYPLRAIKRNLSGWVDVYFTVTASGETADIVVNQSEPSSLFDRAATDAVEKWAFQPVEYRGQVISQRAGARLVFRIAE